MEALNFASQVIYAALDTAARRLPLIFNIMNNFNGMVVRPPANDAYGSPRIGAGISPSQMHAKALTFNRLRSSTPSHAKQAV
jgi:hypothetical protein